MEKRRVRVRLAEVGDAEFLPAVERSAGEVFRGAPGLEWIADDEEQSEERHRAYAAAGTAWVVVDEADRPFGFLSAERFGEELHIWELAVRQSDQGRGAGRALLDASFSYARQQGLAAVTLTTFRGLTWNELLYARMGFKTLREEHLGERLAQVLTDEGARGLPAERRCAMRLELGK